MKTRFSKNVVAAALAVLIAIVVVLGLWPGGAIRSAHAQGLLYDDFSDKELDATKWIGFQAAPGSFGGAPLELVRKIRRGHGAQQGKLEMSHRMVGASAPGGGAIESRNRLGLTQFFSPLVGLVQNFAGVEFDVVPLVIEAVGCPTPGPTPTRVRAGFNTQFFNDPAIPNTGGNTGNIGAILELRRNSTSLDPADTIRALGIVYRCQNADCSQTISAIVDLGLVAREEEARLRLVWQPELDGVSFQRGTDSVGFVSYAAPPFNVNPAIDETLNPPKPVGSFFRVLDLVVTAPGCAEERTEAEIAAFFDNVVVLPLSP